MTLRAKLEQAIRDLNEYGEIRQDPNKSDIAKELRARFKKAFDEIRNDLKTYGEKLAQNRASDPEAACTVLSVGATRLLTVKCEKRSERYIAWTTNGQLLSVLEDFTKSSGKRQTAINVRNSKVTLRTLDELFGPLFDLEPPA